MSCTDIEDKLNAFLDGELIDAEQKLVEAHLKDCGRCQRTVSQLQTIDRDLVHAFAPYASDRQDFVDRTVAALGGSPRSRPRRSWATLLLAAAAGFAIAAVIFMKDQKTNEPLSPIGFAMVKAATGLVEIKDEAGMWRTASAQMEIPRGATIRTQPAVKCSLDFSDGTELRLNGGTELAIRGARDLSLARGQIFAHVAPDPLPFAVHTEQIMIEALGTTLDVSHVPRGETGPSKGDAGNVLTRVAVLEGTVRMGSETVHAGHLCDVLNGVTQKPTPADHLLIITNWVNEILAIQGTENPEFEARVNELLSMLGATKMAYLYESEIRDLGDHCALPLARYLQDPKNAADRDRRVSAASILADVATKDHLEDLVSLLADSDPEVRTRMSSGLKRLTGMFFGFDEVYWKGPDTNEGLKRWQQFLKEYGGSQR